MSCQINTTFQHVSQVGYTLLNSELESNLKSYLDWGFLGIGGWFNVEIPTSGAFGGTFDQMRLVDDPSYTEKLQYAYWDANNYVHYDEDDNSQFVRIEVLDRVLH